jgi:hypothetical protein
MSGLVSNCELSYENEIAGSQVKSLKLVIIHDDDGSGPVEVIILNLPSYRHIVQRYIDTGAVVCIIHTIAQLRFSIKVNQEDRPWLCWRLYLEL